MSKIGDVLALGTVAILALVLGVILRGFVLAQLWSMFLVPLGLPSIGIATGLGISMVGQMLLESSGSSSGSKDDTSIGITIAATVFSPLLIWAMGGFIHLFV